MKIVVNLITTFRFLGALSLFYLKSRISSKMFIASIVLIFLTDSIDGNLARKFKVQTMYGSVMDAVADKALCITLIILSVGTIEAFTSILIGEIVISLINIIFKIMGRNPKSRRMGKIKMWAISVTLVLGYLNYFGILNYMSIVNFACTITFILQILTIIDYIQYLRQKETIQQNKKKIKSLDDLWYVLFNTDYYLDSIGLNTITDNN